MNERPSYLKNRHRYETSEVSTTAAGAGVAKKMLEQMTIHRRTPEERATAQAQAVARVARAQELLRTCAVCHEVAAEQLDTMQGIRICEFCAELEASREPPRYGR